MRKKKTGKKINVPVMFKEYFKAPNFYLYHGDCLEVLAKTKENAIDMIFADPPYNLSNGGFTVHAGRRVSVHKGDWDKSRGVDLDFQFHLSWIEACRRVLKPEGTIWISGVYEFNFGPQTCRGL